MLQLRLQLAALWHGLCFTSSLWGIAYSGKIREFWLGLVFAAMTVIFFVRYAQVSKRIDDVEAAKRKERDARSRTSLNR